MKPRMTEISELVDTGMDLLHRLRSGTVDRQMAAAVARVIQATNGAIRTEMLIDRQTKEIAHG